MSDSYNSIEPVDNLVAEAKHKEDVSKVPETSALVKHLQNKIAELQEELKELRQNNKHLNRQLDDYAQTATANISKRSLNYYVESILERQLTDKEWLHFIKTFTYDSSDLDRKIYAWITKNLNVP